MADRDSEEFCQLFGDAALRQAFACSSVTVAEGGESTCELTVADKILSHAYRTPQLHLLGQIVSMVPRGASGRKSTSALPMYPVPPVRNERFVRISILACYSLAMGRWRATPGASVGLLAIRTLDMGERDRSTPCIGLAVKGGAS